MGVGPFRDDRIHVLAEKCSTCIFRPGNPMHLKPGRVKDILDSNIENDSALQCHKTLAYSAEQWDPAICRGFFDHPRSDESFPVRLARAMDLIEYDPIPEDNHE